MGRDLLAQDYLLKQLTSSLMYPQGDLGKKFWSEVYSQAQEKFGTTDIPVDTFNKVWIVPAKARQAEPPASTLPSELAIDTQATQGANRLPNNPMQYFVDQNKISGINIPDPKESEKIWARYVEAFKKGVFNYIDDGVGVGSFRLNQGGAIPLVPSDNAPRKYFSGGLNMDMAMMTMIHDETLLPQDTRSQVVIMSRLETVENHRHGRGWPSYLPKHVLKDSWIDVDSMGNTGGRQIG